jgi:hypothetical protein
MNFRQKHLAPLQAVDLGSATTTLDENVAPDCMTTPAPPVPFQIGGEMTF